MSEGSSRRIRLLIAWLIYGLGMAAQSGNSVTFIAPFETGALPSGDIRALFQDQDGYIWIGSRAGLFRYDGDQLKSYLHTSEDTQSLSGNHILCITQDQRGFIWIGTDKGGANRLDPGTGQITRYSYSKDLTNSDVQSIWSIWPTDTVVWFCTRDGLIQMNLNSLDMVRHRIVDHPVTADQKRQNMLRCIRPDPHDPSILWMTTLSGLYSFHIPTEQFTWYWSSSLSVLTPLEDETDGQYMYSAFEPIDSSWLLGSWGGGHYIYHRLSQTWERILIEPKNHSFPLSDNVILQYVPLADTAILFSGSKAGVFFPHSGTMEFFTIPGTPMPRGHYHEAMVLDRHGFLWISASHQIFRSTEPLVLPAVTTNPVFRLTSVMIDGLAVNDTVWHHTHSLILQPHQKDLTIRFQVVDPARSFPVRYRYAWGKHPSTWVDVGTQTSIRFTELRPGKKTLTLQAYHPTSEALYGECVLDVEVKTYFFRTGWFLSLAGIILTGGGLFFYANNVRRIRDKYRLKVQYEMALAQSELATLRAQLNPHFLFNALTSVKHYIIENEPRQATHFLNTFASLVRLALEHTKCSLIPLEDEITFTRLFLELEQVRLGNQLMVHWDIEPSVPVKSVLIPPMILQPFVENAIWHGIANLPKGGQLWIRVTTEDNMLIVRIEDDGIGRAESEKMNRQYPTRRSMGVQLTTDRIQLMEKVYGQKAHIETTDLFPERWPPGTSVRITIPINDSSHAQPVSSLYPG